MIKNLVTSSYIYVLMVDHSNDSNEYGLFTRIYRSKLYDLLQEVGIEYGNSSSVHPYISNPINMFLKEISVSNLNIKINEELDPMNTILPLKYSFKSGLYNNTEFTITLFETPNFQFYRTFLEYMKQLGLFTNTTNVNSNYIYSGNNKPNITNTSSLGISNYYKIKRLTVYNQVGTGDVGDDIELITFYNFFPVSVSLNVQQSVDTVEILTTSITFSADIQSIGLQT